MSALLFALLISLCLTLAAELGVAALVGVRGWDFLFIALINCLTNPIVNYVYDLALYFCGYGSAIPYIILAVLEIGTVFAEGLLFSRLLRFRRFGGFRLSLILNGSSFLIGELIVVIRLLITKTT